MPLSDHFVKCPGGLGGPPLRCWYRVYCYVYDVNNPIRTQHEKKKVHHEPSFFIIYMDLFAGDGQQMAVAGEGGGRNILHHAVFKGVGVGYMQMAAQHRP